MNTPMQTLQNISLGVILHVVLLLATVPRILRIKRNASVAIAWLLFVFLTPVVGTMAFWSIGDPSLRRSIRRVIHGPPLHRVMSPYARQEIGSPRLQRILRRLHETPTTTGNRVDFFTDAGVFFRRLEDDLRAARHEICFQFYIFRDDKYGRRFARILCAQARRGVDVYFLYDAIGSKKLPDSFLRRLRKSGVHCHPFLPFLPLRRRFQINFRNHRKLVIIDRQVAYTGGVNVGREYAGEDPQIGPWFDAQLRVAGPAVPQLLDEFAADWVFASETSRSPFDAEPAWLREPCGAISADPAQRGAVQTVSSGPDQPINRMHSMMFEVITSARRRLWIASPYLVPDEAMNAALLNAAYAGVDVRILMQGDHPDQWIPWLAANYFAAPLIEAGVRVYRYQRGMMHAKMVLADDDFATVGSANLDVRSLALNFELNMVLYSQHEIGEVEALFRSAFTQSRELGEEFVQRKWYRRLHENFCRLFAPVL
ncbi:MAG: cardiolipin synthase [Candidatus Sumerlaeota bacterium]|nr:cardiolipin synthase [Candidatus Sumerlaeota bacterium]